MCESSNPLPTVFFLSQLMVPQTPSVCSLYHVFFHGLCNGTVVFLKVNVTSTCCLSTNRVYLAHCQFLKSKKKWEEWFSGFRTIHQIPGRGSMFIRENKFIEFMKSIRAPSII